MKFRWLKITPLLTPVVPEEYNKAAVSSPRIETLGSSEIDGDFAIKSLYVKHPFLGLCDPKNTTGRLKFSTFWYNSGTVMMSLGFESLSCLDSSPTVY